MEMEEGGNFEYTDRKTLLLCKIHEDPAKFRALMYMVNHVTSAWPDFVLH